MALLRSLQYHGKTHFGLREETRAGDGKLTNRIPTAAQPLIRPAPRSAMVFPLVVLIAVLPGMVALNSWDLTPPGPLWGIRGLVVLSGHVLDQIPASLQIKPLAESAAFQAVAFQPPLYAWLEALGFWLTTDHDPLASVLPSYIAGSLLVVLVYLHGRLWRGAGLGLTAALLVGFNQNLLLRMQEATPNTLAISGVLVALLAYGWHERLVIESTRAWSWAGPAFWSLVGGLALGLALLSAGALALLTIPIIALHQASLNASRDSLSPWPSARFLWFSHHRRPGLVNGLLALFLALALASPWFILMVRCHGWRAITALLNPPDILGPSLTLLPRLVKLAPVTSALGLFGALRAIQLALVNETQTRNSIGGAFWFNWLAVATLAPKIWPSGPRSAFDLLVLIPLSLLAAQTIADLANRRISVRSLMVLAPTTAISVASWASVNLSGAVDDLIHGRTDSATALGLHLVVDVVIGLVLVIWALHRWALHRDDRQRYILAGFLSMVLAATVIIGLREVLFRHSETRALLSLRTMVLRRNRDEPFQTLAVVNPFLAGSVFETASSINERPLPGGRLRFILRTALPNLPQRDVMTLDELFTLPEGKRLIILAGTRQRLSSADQAKLSLEAIHPGRSGILDAYATARQRFTRR
jgi:4-amino-4-deoxy-L-arabinose transferase-like glycosyltransferase